MNTRAAGRGTTTAGIAATTDAVTTVAAAGERGRQGTRRGVIYQPGYTLTKSATFPENRTTSVSRLLTGSSTVPFHRGGRCFVRLPVSRSLTGSSTVPVHREGGSRQRMSGPSTMSHPALWTCPACGRPLTVALNPEGGEAGAHRPLEISRASAAAHACTPAARFPQLHSASSSSITGYEPASCQPWQPPVSAGAEDDEGVISQSEYTLTKPSSCPNHRDHVTHRVGPAKWTSPPTYTRSRRRRRRTNDAKTDRREVGTPGACTNTGGIDHEPTARRRTTVRTGMRKVRSKAPGARILRKRREPATPASVEVQAENRDPPPRANRAAARYPVYGYPGVRTRRPSTNPHRTDLPRRREYRQRDVDPGMRTLQPLGPTRTEPQRSGEHAAETPKSVPSRCSRQRSSQHKRADRNRPPNRNGRISQARTTRSEGGSAPDARLTPCRRIHL